MQQLEQARQEREAWLDADNNRIIQELKEYEAKEHRKQIARRQVKETVTQEQIQAMKEAKLSQIIVQKLKKEQTRIQREPASSQKKIQTDLQDRKASTHQDEIQALEEFISVNEVGENYTSI